MTDSRLSTPVSTDGWARVRGLTFVASRVLVDADLRGEAVILSLKTRQFHGLDPVGARAWQLLKAPITFAALRETIVSEYDVTPAQCERDLLALLQDLEAGRSSVCDGPSLPRRTQRLR